jgi:hypothetical protein
MINKAGRPKKRSESKQTEVIPIRLTESEKESFQLCADLAGISLSSWTRERLRLASIKELESAGRKIPFLKEASL